MSLPIFLLIIAHFLTDLCFQSKWIADNKRFFNKQMLVHVFISTIGLSLVLFNYLLPLKALSAALLWLFTHLLVDIAKTELNQRLPKPFYWPLFGLDQILHLTVIFLISQAFFPFCF